MLSILCIFQNSLITVTEKTNKHGNLYTSLLHLKKVNISDVGYYYCGPESANINKEREKFKKIYIFVQGNITTRLF